MPHHRSSELGTHIRRLGLWNQCSGRDLRPQQPLPQKPFNNIGLAHIAPALWLGPALRVRSHPALEADKYGGSMVRIIAMRPVAEMTRWLKQGRTGQHRSALGLFHF